MKYISCPVCGDELKTRWSMKRKLQQTCIRCDWKGEPYTPENKQIIDTKTYYNGIGYELFDRYGHVLMISGKYETEKKAIEDLTKDLDRGKTDEYAGPYTAVLWEEFYTLKGKTFK